MEDIVIEPEPNTAPVAAFTASALMGTAPLEVTFDGSESSDEDGDELTFIWNFGNGETSAMESPTITFDEVGTYLVTLVVSDGMDTSEEVTETIVVEEEEVVEVPDHCTFDTPRENRLSSISESYSDIHVLGENGPDLDDIRRFIISWNVRSSRLSRFGFVTQDDDNNRNSRRNNRNSYSYTDLSSSIEHSFDESAPQVSISDSGIEGLDGTYYATIDDDNFVLVSVSGGFTLYFSDSSRTPDCEEDSTANKSIADNFEVVSFPNPATNFVTVSVTAFNGSVTGKEVVVSNLIGETLEVLKIAEGQTSTNIDLSEYASGIYIVSVYEDSKIISTNKIVKE